MLTTVRSKAITDGLPKSGAAGEAYATMLDGYATYAAVTTKAYAAESRNPW